MIRLDEETPEDRWEVEALYDLCFAPGREALSSYRFRDDVAPVRDLCLVARDEHGTLASVIRYWPVRVAAHPVLLLGPIAVHPTRQGEGLGALLMMESLTLATTLGWARVMLVGDAPYYRRFGFDLLGDVVMPPPTNPARVLGKALQPGGWANVAGPVQKAI